MQPLGWAISASTTKVDERVEAISASVRVSVPSRIVASVGKPLPRRGHLSLTALTCRRPATRAGDRPPVRSGRDQARYAVHMLLIRVLWPGVNWL